MLTLHHVGVLVSDLEQSIAAYRLIFPSISTPVLVTAQGVRVCFVDTGGSVLIELIAVAGEDAVVRTLIKRGISYYHLGYVVQDFNSVLIQLVELGYRELQTFASEAFGYRRCAFLMSPLLHLIEIIEVDSFTSTQRESNELT